MHPILDLWVPALLVLMMFVVGSGLTTEDFRRLGDRAILLIAATAAQLVLLPAIAGLLILVFDPVAPSAIGLLLLSVCPGGAISNYYAHLVKANVALSVVLTAITSLACTVTTPFAAQLVFSLVWAEGTRVHVPAGRVLLQLALFVLLPIAIGMGWRSRQPARVRRWLPLLNRISIISLVALLVTILVDQRHAIGGGIGPVLVLAVAFTLACFAVGAALGWALRARPGESASLALEFSVRNLGVMALVAVNVLGNTEYLLFGAVFFIVQMPTALAAVGILKRMTGRRGSLSAIES